MSMLSTQVPDSDLIFPFFKAKRYIDSYELTFLLAPNEFMCNSIIPINRHVFPATSSISQPLSTCDPSNLVLPIVMS